MARLAPDAAVEIGRPLPVTVDPRRLHFFDGQTERAL
jgi:hypothetical protein